MNCYTPYVPCPSVDFRCCICFEDDNTEKTEAMSHGGRGDLHPVHKECAKILALYRSFCPVCREQLNTRPLVPWRRLIVLEVGNILVDVVMGSNGATIGASGALWGAFFGNFLGSTMATQALTPIMGGAGFFLVLGSITLEPARSRRAVISRIAAASLFGGVIGTVTGMALPAMMVTVVGAGTVLAVVNGIFERYFA